MGSAGSKAAQKTTRKFPSRAPGAALPPRPPPTSRPSPAARARAQASYTKDDAIRADGTDPSRPDFADPAFSARLRQMGIVDPNPTFSPSSTASPAAGGGRFTSDQAPPPPGPSYYPSSANNATLGVLEARRQLQEQADREFDSTGKSTDQGRQFLDVATIRDILILRRRGIAPAEIEARLRLRKGVVGRLGPPGVVEATGHAAPQG